MKDQESTPQPHTLRLAAGCTVNQIQVTILEKRCMKIVALLPQTGQNCRELLRPVPML